MGLYARIFSPVGTANCIDISSRLTGTKSLQKFGNAPTVDGLSIVYRQGRRLKSAATSLKFLNIKSQMFTGIL